MKIGLGWGIAVGLTACLAVAAIGLRDRVAPADVAMVLGNKVERDGRPSRRLARRLDAAADLFDRGVVRWVVVSGGREKSGLHEVDAMTAYLVQARRVPASRILADRGGASTFWTAIDTRRILRDHGLRTAIVVSQYFHVPRCRLAFARAGIPVAGWVHARIWEWRDVYSIAREVVGLARYAVRRDWDATPR